MRRRLLAALLALAGGVVVEAQPSLGQGLGYTAPLVGPTTPLLGAV